MMKPLLIFFVLLILGAMFVIGEHPEYNPLKSSADEAPVASENVMAHESAKADEHQGEE